VQARCPSRGMAPPARRAIADAAPRPEDAEPDLRDCRDGARGRGREREHRNAVQSRRRLPVRPRDRRRVHCHGLLHGQRDVRLGANPPARRPAPKDLRSKSRAPPRVRAGLGRERGWGGAGRTRTAVGTTRTPSTSTRNPPPSRSPYASPYRTNDALIFDDAPWESHVTLITRLWTDGGFQIPFQTQVTCRRGAGVAAGLHAALTVAGVKGTSPQAHARPALRCSACVLPVTP